MRFILVLLTFLLCVSATAAHKPVYIIYTGPEKGTHYKVAQDIKAACTDLDINVMPTSGSISNANSITHPPQYPGNRIALIQQDVLDVSSEADPRLRQFYQVLSPLYKEDITIIVNKKSSIRSVADLAGKKVGMGAPGSGNWFTSNHIKKTLKLRWTSYDRPIDESMLMVMTGQLDALILIDNTPLDSFREIGKPMNDHVAIIPFHAQGFDKLYAPTRIPAKTYAWADYPIETKSVMTMLVAAADVPNNAIKELKSCLTKNLPAIQKFGNPKWKEISTNLK